MPDPLSVFTRAPRVRFSVLVLSGWLLGGALGATNGTLLDATDRARAERTLSEIRIIGAALLSWLTDAIVGANHPRPADEPGWSVRNETGDVAHYLQASHARVTELLVPKYLPRVLAVDGWGNPYEFAINGDLMHAHVIGIRSAGRDGVFESDDYILGGFPVDDFDADVVWADGFFMRYPDREAPEDTEEQPVEEAGAVEATSLLDEPVKRSRGGSRAGADGCGR